MKNKVIVFDVDGTLFDTKAGITATINDVLSRYKMDTIDDETDKYIGLSTKSFKNLIINTFRCIIISNSCVNIF